MKQIIQSFKTGKTELIDVPRPLADPNKILIKTKYSLISAGTEKMLVNFGKSNLLAKAKQKPEKVKQVMDKMKTDGLFATLNTVQAKLDEPVALGYCNVGEVVGLGLGVSGFQIGDRVLSNGSHAEYVSVGKNLCAKIPDNVSYKEAVFSVLGAIALQSVRLAKPEIGESFAVFGLGLVGMLTCQILLAHGCQVICFDYNARRVELAGSFGTQAFDLSKNGDPIGIASQLTKECGVDGVIIAASTASSDPVHQSAQMCRKRGRIILSGVTGLELNRSDFYNKELTFQVSCSYGPGRYDDSYELSGNDYPYGFVRWTEQRNFSAILELIASAKLDVKPLISEVVNFENAIEVYENNLSNGEILGILLKYGDCSENNKTVIVQHQVHKIKNQSEIVVGSIGAGNFARQILYPALGQTDARLKIVSDLNPSNATYTARKFGFQYSSTDTQQIFNDPEINTIFILTRHNVHADLVDKALQAGKHVYVEKPLALSKEELGKIEEQYKMSTNSLMVGFNRRFAPQVVKMKELLSAKAAPLSAIYTVNAGAIPVDHWVHDLNIGGGRIIGEACHFIDLISFLADSPVSSVSAFSIGGDTLNDKVSITLTMANGSIGTVHYFANGTKKYPKEIIQIFCEGRVLELNNFRTMKGYGWGNFSKYNLWKQDKGHQSEIKQFIENLQKTNKALIPFEQLKNVTLASFAAIESIQRKEVIKIK